MGGLESGGIRASWLHRFCRNDESLRREGGREIVSDFLIRLLSSESWRLNLKLTPYIWLMWAISIPGLVEPG